MTRLIQSCAAICLAAALLLGMTMPALSNVLTNGDFEDTPPGNMGNNFTNVGAPWIYGSGQGPNVVKVDGVGGYNYGSNGPESDASGAFAGVPQHYLDIRDGDNDFYQLFTPLCTGEVIYSASFSTRANGAGVAGITIVQDSDGSIVGARQQTNLPAGNSMTDPWIQVSYTTSLTAGTAYRFLVDMDNNMNMDNAVVEFTENCPAYDDPPIETDKHQLCTAFTPELSCDAGTPVVTLINTLAGQFDPTDISITSQTTGVTLLQSSPNALVYGLQGATAGQTVTLWAEAIAKGGGSAAGLDKCCMGEISLQIPQDFVCEPPVVLDVTKTCEDISGPVLMQQCTIDVHYEGPPPSPALTMTDTLTGATLMGAPSSTDNWACSGTSPASCSIDAASDPLIDWGNFNSTLVFNVRYQDAFENCAKAAASGAEDEACYSSADPDLTITKTANQQQCVVGQPCDFTITVTNPSSSDFNGPLTLTDVVTTGQLGQFTAITPPLCAPSDFLINGTCTGTASIPSGGSQAYVVTWLPPLDQNGYRATNCAGVSSAGGVAGYQQGTQSDAVCATVSVEPPSISITKTGPTTCPQGTICTYAITVSTGAVPYTGPILLYDTAPNGFEVVSVTPAGCGSSLPTQNFVCVVQTSLPANGSQTYQIGIQSQMGDDKVDDNCAGLFSVMPDVAVGDYSFSGGMPPELDAIVAEGTDLGRACVPVSDDAPPICGNGAVEAGEMCDDGNTATGDGCSNQCTAASAGNQMSIDKVCAPAVAGPTGLDIACTITINANGPWPAGGIHFTEVMGQNLSPTDTGAALGPISWPDIGATNSAWIGPNTTTGFDASNSQLPSSGTTTINAMVHLMNESYIDETNNCATVVGLDANGQNIGAPLTDCENFTPPATAKVAQTGPDLSIQKTATGPCSIDLESRTKICEFKITVTNNGGAPFQGPVVLSDAFKGPVSDVSFTGLECRRAGDGAFCLTGDASIPAGGEIFILLKTTHPDTSAPTFENCASLGAGSDPMAQAMVVQTALKLMGKYEGGIDGQIGRKSRAAIGELQTQLGLPETGAVDQALLDGLGVPNGGPEACVTVDLPSLPRPQCDKGTTVPKGGDCLCKFKNMYQKDDTSCGCVKGTKFSPSKGCLKPRQDEISKPKPNNPKPSGPNCDPATTTAQGGTCVCLRQDFVPSSPTQCAPKDFVKRDCPKDHTFIKGLGCVEDRVFFGDSSPSVDKPPGKP